MESISPNVGQKVSLVIRESESLDSLDYLECNPEKWSPHWVPDAQCNTCTSCSSEFGLILRRHHCRKCGKIFCKECSNKFISYKEKVYRVCTSCFDKSISSNQELFEAGKQWFHRIPEQTGKIVICTGANSGTGFEWCRHMAKKGAVVIMACRDQTRGDQAVFALKNEFPRAQVELMLLDISNPTSIQQFVETFQSQYDRLDILCCNAGVMMLPFGLTEEGIEVQFATNHLGHYILSLSYKKGKLLSVLKRSPSARIVHHSSSMHLSGTMVEWDDLNNESKFNTVQRYSFTKQCNIWFSQLLAKKFKELRMDIISVSAEPGWAATGLQGKATGSLFGSVSSYMNDYLAQSAEAGAMCILYAAFSPDVKQGGHYVPSFEMWGEPKEKSLSDYDTSYNNCYLLWKKSEEISKFIYNWEQ